MSLEQMESCCDMRAGPIAISECVTGSGPMEPDGSIELQSSHVTMYQAGTIARLSEEESWMREDMDERGLTLDGGWWRAVGGGHYRSKTQCKRIRKWQYVRA